MLRRPRPAARDFAYHVRTAVWDDCLKKKLGSGGWRNDSRWNRRYGDENGRMDSDPIRSTSFRRFRP